MTKIDENLISKLEKLSRLRLNPDEKVKIASDLEKIVDMFDKLQEVDTEGVVPTMHMSNSRHPLREDRVQNELTTDEFLKNAPELYKDFIAVPKFLKPTQKS